MQSAVPVSDDFYRKICVSVSKLPSSKSADPNVSFRTGTQVPSVFKDSGGQLAFSSTSLSHAGVSSTAEPYDVLNFAAQVLGSLGRAVCRRKCQVNVFQGDVVTRLDGAALQTRHVVRLGGAPEVLHRDVVDLDFGIGAVGWGATAAEGGAL